MWAAFLIVFSVGLVSEGSAVAAAEYLCRFDQSCLASDPENCQGTDEMIFARTGEDAFFGAYERDLGIPSISGDSDLFGTPGLLPGTVVPSSMRRAFPDDFRRASPRLNMAERVSDISEEAGVRLRLSGPNVMTSPAEALTTAFVDLTVGDDLGAVLKVEGKLRIDTIHYGVCEEL